MVTVSAPGKCYLIGEHAVVYGQPAIIAAIGLRTRVEAGKSEDVRYADERFGADFNFDLDGVKKTTKETLGLWQKCSEAGNFSELFRFIKKNGYENYKKAVVGIALGRLGISGGVSVRISGDVPPGGGLGSSASLSVALTKAIAGSHDVEKSRNEINDIAYGLEKIIHGTPSGGDNSACCFGGLTWFRKSEPKNEIVSLKDEIPYKLENFVIINVGDPEKSTGELVQQVRDLDEAFRNKRTQRLGELTAEMREVLKNKNFARMKEIMNEAQKNLAELTVSTKEIDEMCKAVREIGGCAKLSGAGGGGNVLCWNDDIDKLKEVVKQLGYEPTETELAVEGVRVES